jgi:hypothetical protein
MNDRLQLEAVFLTLEYGGSPIPRGGLRLFQGHAAVSEYMVHQTEKWRVQHKNRSPFCGSKLVFRSYPVRIFVGLQML